MNIFILCHLLLNADHLVVNQVAFEEEELQLAVESTNQQAVCPACAKQSQAIHSTYLRYPKDLPWANQPVVLQLKVKRFFCHNPACPKKTFAERFPDLVAWYAHRTKRVVERQQRLAANMSARTAEMMLGEERMSLSDTMINQLVRTLPDPEAPSVRILGVDDWAKRKGQRYGTILVDLERNQVVDLLADRTADTLVDWFDQHPGIEIVSRDRSQTYAEAISRGAPEAVQVADRWHLLKNLSDTVYLLLQQEEKNIRKQSAVSSPIPNLPEEEPVHIEKPLTQAEQRRKERMERVDQLRQMAWSQKEIAQHLHIHPKTVRRYRNHPSPRFERTRTGRLLDPYKPYVLQRWNEGCHNATQLYREIQPKGFQGHVTIAMDFVRTLRKSSGLPPRARKSTVNQPLPVDAVQSPPTLRTLTWWILKRPEDRDEKDESLLARMSEGQPKLTETITLARKFAEIVRQQQVDQWDAWLERASQSEYLLWQNFAENLKQDEQAIRAGLQYTWSNGQTEGQVNRLKCLKRMMYGRAKDDLLRKRVLWHGKPAFT